MSMAVWQSSRLPDPLDERMNMLISSIGLIFLLFLALSYSQLNKVGPVSSSALNDVRLKAIAQLTKPTSLEQSYYATRILKKLNVQVDRCSCDTIPQLADESPYDTFYASEITKACKCNGYVPPEPARVASANALQSSDLIAYSGAALAYLSYNEPKSLDSALEFLRPFALPDCLYKSKLSDDESDANIATSSTVLQLLSSYVAAGHTNPELADISDRCSKLLPSGDDDGPVDPTLLAAIRSLSDRMPSLSSAKLNYIGETLIHQLFSNDFPSIALSLESLYTLTEYKAGPMFVQLDQSVIDSSSTSKVITFKATNILDMPMTITGLEVKSLKHSNSGDIVFRGPIEGNMLDLSSNQLKVGRYVLDLSVTVAERSNAVNFKKYFTVKDTISISDVLAGLTNSKQTSISDLEQVSENSLSGVQGAALDNDVFHVAFTLSAKSFAKPHQSIIRFSHLESNIDTFFQAKPTRALSDSKGSVYRSTVSLADEIESFLYLSGDYSVEIICSDAAYVNQIQYRLGTVTFKFPPKPSTESSLYTKSLLHTSDNTLAALPEIAHVMRPPAKQASLFMSTLFTILVVSPLLVYLGVVLSKTKNLNRLKNMSVLLFAISLIAILGLYLGYWFALPGFSFYETIRHMLFILPIVYLIGRTALGAISQDRSKEEVEKKKKN